MAELSMETFEKATPDLIQALRDAFQEKYDAGKPDFHSEDLARVKSDDLWMKRFLAAQEYNPKLATQMLYETCQWRKEFGTNDLDHTKLNQSGIERGILFIRNQDKWGKKLLIFKAKNHQKGIYPMDDLKRFIVYFFERIEREAQSDQISVIFDMKDTGWNNMDMDFIRYLITLLKQYYPWFVNYLMIYEMPWLLKSAWNIIKGWLPAVFVERVKFIDKKTIGDFIDENNQLVDWGGKDDYKYEFTPEVCGRSYPVDKAKSTSTRASKVNSIHLDSPAPAPRIANGKPPPDVKPRKVKFTGQDGGVDRTDVTVTSIDSPTRQSQSQQTPAQEMSKSPPQRTPDPQQLVEVDETLIFSSQSGIIQGTFHVQSLTKATVIIKVKTTSPEKYRVRPTIGLIEGEARATINVQVHEGVRLTSLPSDRFQVQASLVPRGFQIESSDGETDSAGAGGSHGINFGDLQAQWKNITDRPGAQIETHRLTCSVDPRMEEANGGSASPLPGLVTMNEEDMRRGLVELEQKLTERITAKIGDRIKTLEYLLYGILALLTLLGLLIYFGIPPEFKLPDNICTMTDHDHKAKPIEESDSCI